MAMRYKWSTQGMYLMSDNTAKQGGISGPSPATPPRVGTRTRIFSVIEFGRTAGLKEPALLSKEPVKPFKPSWQSSSKTASALDAIL